MKAVSTFLAVALVAAGWSVAEPLTRADVAAIPAGPVAFEKALLHEVLMAAKKAAAGKGIHLWADQDALTVSREQVVTLHAEGLTLDGLLEFATRTTGTEWKIESNKIAIYSTATLRAAHAARQKSRARRQLAEVIIPEIVFEKVEVDAAFRMVREEAIKVAGLGAVPKVDLPAPPTVVKTVSLKVTNASVLALFDLLAAVSGSTIDWAMRGSKIVVLDEAKRREEDRLRRIAERELDAEGGADDPFAGPARPMRPRPPRVPRPVGPGFNTESYDHFGDNPFFSPRREPLSTFSVDVDTASYANIRRLIRAGGHIPVDAARLEELVNYFPYDYAPPARGGVGQPVEGSPFAVHLEAASAPWAPEHRLVRIGLKGYEIDWNSRPPSNLVFLLDVSGSMSAPNKLGLVKKSLELLVRRLGERDRISVVVYAGASGMVLPPTPGNKAMAILDALGKLQAGGSTNAGSGIALAYRTAREQFLEGGNNRVILCTDGDFNVGTTDRGSLVGLVEKEARSGVFLTVLGFGMGNYKDGMLESLSNKGNGNYAYIDSQREARKVFVQGLSGTLVTIAKDVKVQVEFNPAKVGAYRLLGYENRLLEAQDFDDDSKDAGEIGAGHTVTAFYEVVPPGKEESLLKAVSPLKYQKVKTKRVGPDATGELLTVKLRYKQPNGAKSMLLSVPFTDPGGRFEAATPDFRFASAVASFGMILRDSDYRGDSAVPLVLDIAREAFTDDPEGYRNEFLELVEKFGSRRLPR